MYIESKLKEVDETLFSLDLGEIKESKIASEEIVIKKPCGLRVNSKIQFGRNFFTVDTHLESQGKITDIFRILGEYIRVSYLGKGESQLVYSGERKTITSGSIEYCHECDTQDHIEIPALSPTHYQAIFLSKDYYLKLLEAEEWAEFNPFFSKVKSGKRIKTGHCKFPIDFRLHQLFDQITKSDWEEESKKYYLELKMKELFLCLHLCQQEKPTAESSKFSQEQVEKIVTAHALLIENYKNPPTIKVLARSVLLNELQLKKGFKELYGKTIRGFVIELRMEKAKSLLEKYTVNEMAGILGYKSVPHFINTFKKYYGYTPKQSLKQ